MLIQDAAFIVKEGITSGAHEFFSGGAKLITLPDTGGKIRAADLQAALDRPNHGAHHVKAALSISRQRSVCLAGGYGKNDRGQRILPAGRFKNKEDSEIRAVIY